MINCLSFSLFMFFLSFLLTLFVYVVLFFLDISPVRQYDPAGKNPQLQCNPMRLRETSG